MKARIGKKRPGRKSPWPVQWYPPGEGARTRWFPTREKAAAFAKQKNQDFAEVGYEPEPSAEELRAFRAWRKSQEAVNALPLGELREDYLDHLEVQSGYRWHKDSRITLNKFLASTGWTTTLDLRAPDCQAWLDALPVSATTKRNAWSHLHAWGAWLVEVREALPSNPWSRVRKPRPTETVIGLYTAEELSAYLGWLWEHDRAFLPWEVIQCFAGLRVMNATRIFHRTWSQDLKKPPFNWKTRTVDIPGWVMKRKRRLYSEQFPPVLWTWLEAYQEPGGWIRGECNDHRRRRERAAAGSGIGWKPNGMRYTFASCHLAHYQDPGLTSLLLAHRRSIQLLVDTYDGHATRAEARKVMTLTPPWVGK